MEKSSVIHFARDQFLYASSPDQLTIRIKTKKNDLQSIIVCFGDPFEFLDSDWVFKEAVMNRTGSDETFDYWQINITPPFRRIRYGFKLTDSANESCYFTEKGFYEQLPQDPGYFFAYPYVHKPEVFHAPAWVRDTVWYQIFPERYANGDRTINPPKTLPWNSADPTPINFFGGDLEGIFQHLPYLRDLGITGIYFTPVFKAYSNHKYDTIDYFELDEQFGTKETLSKLVNECHKFGIKVMLDAVFNHCGYYFAPFQDVLKNGAQSRYKDWFHIHDYPLLADGKINYETFAFTQFMPKFNTFNEEVRTYLLDVARYWIKECNIDGWRLDVANEVNAEFWRDFRKVVKSENKDVYILGEVWHDSMPWLRGDQFDSVMNYPFMTAVLELFAQKTITSQEFSEKMTKVIHMYPSNVMESIFNLVDSHDTPRILTECKNDIGTVKQIFTLLLTFIGTPCLYYGDEIGLDGDMDPGCRKCMPWDPAQQNDDLFRHVQRLIALRKQNPVLANDGDLQFIPDIPQVIMYKRQTESVTALVMLNLSEDTVAVPSGGPEPFTILMADPKTAINQQNDTVYLAPSGYAILTY